METQVHRELLEQQETKGREVLWVRQALRVKRVSKGQEE